MERFKNHQGPARRQLAMWALYGRELHELGTGFRFRAVALLIVTIMVLAAVLYTGRFKNEQFFYENTWLAYATSVEGGDLHKLLYSPYPAMKPPWALAFLTDGGQQQAPNVYRLTLGGWDLPALNSRREIVDRLQSAEALDWAFFIRVVLSMAAFLLGYDIICGHHQRAALKLVLSYAVDRWQVLTAKLLALFTCVALPFLVGALSSVLILLTVGGLEPSWGELVKVALMLALGLWASALFVLIAALVSLISREPGGSLTVLTLVWVLAVVVVPAASELLAHRLHPLEPERAIEQELAGIRERVVHRGALSWRPFKEASQDGFAKEKASARIEKMRYDEQSAYLATVLDERFEQVKLARTLALISPMMQIQDLAEQVTGSGILRDRSFIHQVESFRKELETWVQILDDKDRQSPHIYFFPRYMSKTVQVSAQELPVFSFEEVDVQAGLLGAGPRTLLLMVVTLLCLLAVLMGFAGYEVR